MWRILKINVNENQPMKYGVSVNGGGVVMAKMAEAAA
jgi:hypothetical protein